MKKILMVFFLICFYPFLAMAACPFVADDFNDGALGSQWTEEARDGSIIEQSDGIQVTSGGGNLWWDVFTPTRIYQCMDAGDFDVHTQVSVAGMNGQYQQAGILFDQGSGGWTSIMLRWDNSLQYAVQRRDSVGQSTSTGQVSVPGDTVGLRMKRTGSIFTSYFLNSEGDWQVVDHGTVEYTSSGQGSIGVFAMHPGSVVFTANFDYLKTWVVGPPPDVVVHKVKCAWEHDGKNMAGGNIVVSKFPFYMTRTSGSNYVKLVDVLAIGDGPTYTSEMIEFEAVEGETIYFAVAAIEEGQTLESAKSVDLPWVVPVLEPSPPDPVCGDGVVNQASEECDDGNTVNGDGCDSNCQKEPPPPECGDGNLDPGEECDDGNSLSGDGCSNCTIDPPPTVCGDGVVNQPSEECDDGNLINGDGCDSNCKEEPVTPSVPRTVRIIISIEVPEGVNIVVEAK